MVRFANQHNAANNNAAKENANANNNKTGSGKASSKKRLPVTPHPSKKQRSRGGSGGDRNLPSEASVNACVSQINSPDMTEGQGDNENGAGDDDEEEGEQGSEWKCFLESASSENVPNLPAFLGAKSTRESAKENFTIALEECVNGLSEAMIHEMLQDSVVAVHREQGERFEAYEGDIIATMKSNHARRRALVKRMEDTNIHWGKQYKRLRGSILLRDVEGPMLDGKDGPENQDDSVEVKTADDREGNQRADPDWEELAEFEPTRDNVRSFLESRARLQNAEEALSQSLDEIHEGLKAEVDAIVQIVVDFHDQHESACLSLEDDIQYHLMRNCKRRVDFQKSLEESAKQAQGLFANLMSRLAQGI